MRRHVSYETIEEGDSLSALHTITLSPTSMEELKELTSRAREGNYMAKWTPFTVEGSFWRGNIFVPRGKTPDVGEILSWPFGHVVTVHEDGITFGFTDTALEYTKEKDIAVVAGNIAKIFGAQFHEPVML